MKKRIESKLQHPSETPLEWRFRHRELRIIVRARTWFEARERALLVFTQNNGGVEPHDMICTENPYDSFSENTNVQKG